MLQDAFKGCMRGHKIASHILLFPPLPHFLGVGHRDHLLPTATKTFVCGFQTFVCGLHIAEGTRRVVSAAEGQKKPDHVH